MKNITTNKYKVDDNKVLISFNSAFNSIFEDLSLEDFKESSICYRTNRFFTDDLLHDYYRVVEAFGNIAKQEGRKINIFDKALCFGMVLKKSKTFEVIDEEVPSHLSDINEKFIARALVAMLHYSEYSVASKDKAVIPTTALDVESAFKDDKSELDSLLKQLSQMLAEDDYPAERILDLLNRIYILTVLKSNGLDDAEMTRIKSGIKIKETKTAPNLKVKQNTLLKTLKNEREKSFIH